MNLLVKNVPHCEVCLILTLTPSKILLARNRRECLQGVVAMTRAGLYRSRRFAWLAESLPPHFKNRRTAAPPIVRSGSTLILIRHGQSQWNHPPARFSGWVDVPLTVRGRVEAVAAGQLLRSRGFKASRVDVAFTSELQRAHETCELSLASMAGPQQHTWSSDRIRKDARLNERHYGVVQGLDKNDPDVLSRYGDDQVRSWRRSFHAKPPPLDESHEHYRPPPPPPPPRASRIVSSGRSTASRTSSPPPCSTRLTYLPPRTNASSSPLPTATRYAR